MSRTLSPSIAKPHPSSRRSLRDGVPLRSRLAGSTSMGANESGGRK